MRDSCSVAGGTATAYHLLAAALLKSPRLQITFLGATEDIDSCTSVAQKHSRRNLVFTCLKQEHLDADIVETYPLERLAHGVLAWAQVSLVREELTLLHSPPFLLLL